MAGSLQEQLLKAGLVSKEKLDKAEAEKRRKRQGGKGRRKPKSQRGSEVNLERAYAERARLEKVEKDREINRRKEEARRKREENNRLDQLVRPNAMNDPKGEVARFFEWSGKIRKLYVNADQQQQLTDGTLAVVHHRGRFYVVKPDILERVRAIRATAIAFYAPDVPDSPEDDDIPDDLMW